ncbi:hypothetical protein ACFYZ8_13205 [Streptomyces sp. NPDC001668]|uniref:hypothetical protein n=1 Tax=unclassified Streptomyces TaxID=2593676 RepID=UPI0036AAD454
MRAGEDRRTCFGTTDSSVYREFLMAGIFVQTFTFATAGAGAGIADDMHKGLIDRFRSRPMARGAGLTGVRDERHREESDQPSRGGRLGCAPGQPDQGADPGEGVPEQEQQTAFVDSSRMTPWLRHVADWNPFSATVQACRRLFGNPGVSTSDAWPMQHPVWASLIYSVLIVVIFRTLAVRKYRSATA